jgi:hypothetical protein
MRGCQQPSSGFAAAAATNVRRKSMALLLVTRPAAERMPAWPHQAAHIPAVSNDRLTRSLACRSCRSASGDPSRTRTGNVARIGVCGQLPHGFRIARQLVFSTN